MFTFKFKFHNLCKQTPCSHFASESPVLNPVSHVSKNIDVGEERNRNVLFFGIGSI